MEVQKKVAIAGGKSSFQRCPWASGFSSRAHQIRPISPISVEELLLLTPRHRHGCHERLKIARRLGRLDRAGWGANGRLRLGEILHTRRGGGGFGAARGGFGRVGSKPPAAIQVAVVVSKPFLGFCFWLVGEFTTQF